LVENNAQNFYPPKRSHGTSISCATPFAVITGIASMDFIRGSAKCGFLPVVGHFILDDASVCTIVSLYKTASSPTEESPSTTSFTNFVQT